MQPKPPSGPPKPPSGPPKLDLNVPPPGSPLSIAEWRTMNIDARAAAWGASPPGIPISPDKWQRMPQHERDAIWASHGKRQQGAPPKPADTTQANIHVPPPDSGLSIAEWRTMDEQARAAAWEAARLQIEARRRGGGAGRRREVPPPDSDIPMAEWRSMDEHERAAAWKAYEQRHGGAGSGSGSGGGPEQKGNQPNLSVPPPDSGYTLQQWRAMDLEHRADLWQIYFKRVSLEVRPGERIVNEPLLEFLNEQRDPKTGAPYFLTVQDLLNHSLALFDKVCKDFGLDPVVLNRYRKFPLRYFAVLPPPAKTSVPTSSKDANKYFITQYDTIYNMGSPNARSSDNCGPTSLAMVLRALNKLPPAVLASSPEDQIDYVRALMTPNDPRIEDRRVLYPPPNGSIIRVLDADHDLTGFGDAATGAQYAARQFGLPAAKRETGWDNFATAVITNHQPIVLAGVITPEWISLIDRKGTIEVGRKPWYCSKDPGVESDKSGKCPTCGEALVRYYGSVGSNAVDHFIAVLGTTPEGAFIVADPMFAGGTVVMSLDELRTFVSIAPGGSNPEFLNPNSQTQP